MRQGNGNRSKSAWRRVLAAVVGVTSMTAVTLLGLAGNASAGETQSYAGAICQSGEVCLFPTVTDYWNYVGGCESTCNHATYWGNDGLFTGYYPWPLDSTVYLNNTVDVAKNNGTSCGVYLFTGSYGYGTAEWIALGAVSYTHLRAHET